jgi:hypothetical protein
VRIETERATEKKQQKKKKQIPHTGLKYGRVRDDSSAAKARRRGKGNDRGACGRSPRIRGKSLHRGWSRASTCWCKEKSSTVNARFRAFVGAQHAVPGAAIPCVKRRARCMGRAPTNSTASPFARDWWRTSRQVCLPGTACCAPTKAAAKANRHSERSVPRFFFCAKRRDTQPRNLSWMYDSVIRRSKRGPSTALRAREKRGKGKDARNSAQDDRVDFGGW